VSPDINYLDPSQPLFPAGSNPASLAQLTMGGQQGESAFYRGLSAQELMDIVYPKYDAFYNRPAGSPPPEGMSGFGFGQQTEGSLVGDPQSAGYVPGFWDHPIRSEAWEYALSGPQEGMSGDNKWGIPWAGWVQDAYSSAPDPANLLYGRWSSYGFPGDPTQNGDVHSWNLSGDSVFNALTGAGSWSPADSAMGAAAANWLTVEPQWLGMYEGSGYDQWTDLPAEELAVAPFTANYGPVGWAAMGRPDMYWDLPYHQPFVEGDEAFFNRYLALMADPSMGAWAE